MRFYASLLISISLHLCALFVYRREKQIIETQSPEKLTFIETEWEPGKSDKVSGGSHKGGKRPTNVARLSLRDLGMGPRWQADLSQSIGQDGESSSVQNMDGDDDNGNVLNSLKRTVSLEMLYRKLDEAIYYPKEFIDAGIEGTVNGILCFDPLGRLNPKSSRIRSSSNYLRVHIVKVLRSALASPLPPTLRKKTGLRVSYTFTFLLTRVDNSMEMSDDANHGKGVQRGIAGNTLAIYRAAKVIGQWKFGPFAGYGIAPSVGIDPNWFVDRVAKIFNGVTKRKAEIDPLEVYRNSPYWRQSDQEVFVQDQY